MGGCELYDNAEKFKEFVAFCCIFLVIVKFRAGHIGWAEEEPFVANIPEKRRTFPDISRHFPGWLRGLTLGSSFLCRRYVVCHQYST